MKRKPGSGFLLWVLLVLTLAGCASQPIVFKDVVPPEAARLRAVQTGHPVIALVLGGGASRGCGRRGLRLAVLSRHGVRGGRRARRGRSDPSQPAP